MTTLFGTLELLGIPAFDTYNTVVLDGSGDKIGGVFKAHKSGIIDRIAVYCTAVSNPVSTLARLEGVAASLPNNTILAANTSGSFTPAANTLFLVNLTASYNVTVDEIFAATLNAATADATHTQTFNGRISMTLSGGTNSNHHPRAVYDLSAGAWTQQALYPCVIPVYSDGSYPPWCKPRVVTTSVTFNNTSTPDERGNRFTQVGNETCIGAKFYIRGNVAGGNWNVKLYPVTSNNAAPLGSSTNIHSTVLLNTTVAGIAEAYWAGVDLVDGTDYRLVIQPSTANSVSIQSMTCDSQGIREASSHYYSTVRTRTADGDDGAWTDDLTAYHIIWPLYSRSNSVSSAPYTPFRAVTPFRNY